MTPAQLRALADEAEAQADALEATAETHREQARELRRLADRAEGTSGVLHKRKQTGNVSDVTNARKRHSLAIAKAAAGKDPFRLHLVGKISQNRLAKKIGCSVAAISRYRKNRPIPALYAQRIEAAVGWPADADHWPGGLV